VPCMTKENGQLDARDDIMFAEGKDRAKSETDGKGDPVRQCTHRTWHTTVCE
jgi:hypothetical protein